MSLVCGGRIWGISKRDAFYQSLVFEDDSLLLPADETERKQVARSFFGATLVSCADVVIDGAAKLLDDPVEFADFTDEQKKKVLALISHSAYGVLFSQCRRMHQFYGADLEISVTELDRNGEDRRSTRIASRKDKELHHAYFDWAERFGDHYDPDYDARLAYSRSLARPSAD